MSDTSATTPDRGGRLAAFLTGGKDLDATLEHVAAAERLGYGLVLDNHIAARDGLITLAHYAQVTDRIALGTGVYPMLQLSALALAHLAASLDELIGGRLVLGIGTSHRPVIEGWHGVEWPDSPLTAMRETITVLRSLFTTGEATYHGDHVDIEGFRFRGFTPRADLPIMVAALGPKMLQLAGELADGALLWLCSPAYIREVVVPNIREGAERAGRDPAEVAIVPAISCALTDDVDAARNVLRRMLVTYCSLPFYRSVLADSGFADDLERFDAGIRNGDVAAAQRGLSDAMLDELFGIGDAGAVRAAIRRYRDAGATMPGVGPVEAPGARSVTDVLAAVAGDTAGG